MTTISSISCFWFLNEQAKFFLYFASTINVNKTALGFFFFRFRSAPMRLTDFCTTFISSLFAYSCDSL